MVKLLHNGLVEAPKGKAVYVDNWRSYTAPRKTRLSPWKRSKANRVSQILLNTEPGV